ncbi:unnamed protein product [Moneuplotes crassus]|uniref:Uncharacterized protein n=1 Tax=Euplotes crassus TaxID=5936 RepID=A0AAD1U4N0_EUPCR|nr:unnamed protein product [Moneuplotes crassus]
MSDLLKEHKRSKSRSRARQSKAAHDPIISPPGTKSRKTAERLRIITEEERKRREGKEICAKHGQNIVAFARKTGKTLCENCVFNERHDKVVFTATVAKGIHSTLRTEHDEFVDLARKWLQIDPHAVKKEIERKISRFFDIYRNKINDLESLVVDKVMKSQNLEKLLETTQLEDEESKENSSKRRGDIETKYEDFRDEFEDKIKTSRFTYICLNKEHFEQGIEDIKSDNVMLDRKIRRAQKLIDSIFDCTENEERIHNIFSQLTSDLMMVDEKNPVFPEFTTNSVINVTNRDKQDDLIADRSREVTKMQIEPTQAVYHSEEMNSYYFVTDNILKVKELDEDYYQEQKVLTLKNYLTKVITVPTETLNRVFIIGGSKDVEGIQAINDTYEVDLENRSLMPCQRMSEPKLSVAAGLSPDCNFILTAGGSLGQNTPTNSCEMFNISQMRWQKLPPLNLPRMTASLIICTNSNAYCIGGIESSPDDPSMFLPLKSIEWLQYDQPNCEWETLKIKVPFKCSSSGAICMGDRHFIIFGGWNKEPLAKSAYVWYNELHGFNIEPLGNLEKPDTFTSSGLTKRDAANKTSIIFGVNYCHLYDEQEEKFTTIPLKQDDDGPNQEETDEAAGS